MFYVYVLKSVHTEHYYVGQTDNLEKRLQLHNAEKTIYAKRYKPWKIHYFEKFTSRDQAVKREKYFKSHAGRNWLKKNLRA